MTDQFILLSGWWAAMTDQIVLLSGWWTAAIFFTLWVRALLKLSQHLEFHLAERRAAVKFSVEHPVSRKDDSFLVDFFVCNSDELARRWPDWPAYRRRKILELTGEIA
ncbi:hypothetical protein J5N58_06795 [Rhizobium cremeum]|uniref:hypothetical protein n=1 Tax=Rhizobium cremeum TaxID=2813827 RepID=UPI001FD47CEC|nr:hypothetical protein [Rhizobium cremeum]MCJ7996658.1 hypothetical protein [Rhizobium cremeum]MCJ7999382.1 hypothetical protein [Rhizobium cremeum]